MRCPDCNKFVGNDQMDPEVESLDVNGDQITAQVRIANACDQCSTELTEASLEMEDDISAELEAHREKCKDAEFTAEETESERDTKGEGKGRYMKTFYGAKVSYSVTCSECDKLVHEGELSDFIQASCMDPLN